MLTMSRRTAIISGGGGGIGLEIVREFLKMGMNVVICSSSKEKGEAALAKLDNEMQNYCIALGCDVSNPSDVKTCLKTAVEKFGSVDIIINGAGMHDKSSFADIKLDKWNRIISTNLTGTFVMIQEAISYLENGINPRIINLSTIDGRTGGYEGSIGIAAAKGGIIALTRAAARELASKGITVNCVAIGSVDGDVSEERTPEEESLIISKIPIGRLGTPYDIAPAVCFFASEESRYITGSVLDVNGGLFMG